VLLELHFPPDVVAFSAAEKYENGVTTYLAAAGYEDGQVVVWDSSMSTPRRSIQIGEGRIRTLELDPSGLFLLVLDEARRLTVLESTEWQVIESHELEVDGPFLFSPDATTIASLDTSQENIVLFGIYEAEPERIIRNNLAYYSAFTHLYGPYEFWSNGTLVTLGVDLQRGLFLRLPQDGVELLLPYDFSDGDFSIPDAFSTTRDGHGLAVGLASGDLFLWDVSSQEQTAVLRGHNTQSADGWLGAFIELEFSHDATLLLSIGWDGTTRLWNLTSMSVARVIESCCFAEVSGSGEVFFTLDQDTGLLRVWGVSNK
jgi:WD40 repeat protein